MPTYRVIEKIAAPAAETWAVLSEVTSWPEWLPTVTSITPLNSSALQPGAKFHLVQPKLRPATWEVTSLRQGESFIWESKSSGLSLWANHVVKPTGSDSCELTVEFAFSGFLAPLVGLFAGSITQRYMATEASSLKAQAEAANSKLAA